MRKLNKKGIEAFSLLIFFFAFLPIIFLLLSGVGGRESDVNLDFIGKNQVLMKSLFEKSENDLFYNDQLAKYVAWNTIPELASKTGLLECSDYNGYCLLDVGNFPDYEQNFENLFFQSYKERFNQYFGKEIDYEISVQNSFVVGIAKDTLDYNEEIRDGGINYNIKPHFEIRLNYDFSDYEVIKEDIPKLILELKGKQELETCVRNSITGFSNEDLTWQFGGCGTDNIPIQNNKAAFCVITNKQIKTYDGYKEILYKFALEFPATQAVEQN